MIIYPHQGVDKIRFGMSRVGVERAVGAVPKRFRRTEFATNDEDLFVHLGLSVTYDEHDRCDTIQLGRGFGTDLEYSGYNLFAHPAREVREWARAQDPGLDQKDGFISKLLGLSMWADWIDEVELEPGEEQEPGMSFLVFRPGYYDGLEQRLEEIRQRVKNESL